MKIQDVIFLASLFPILIFRRALFVTIAGLVCVAAAIPLFAFWIFFTAERLVWYAAAFFLIAVFAWAIEYGKEIST